MINRREINQDAAVWSDFDHEYGHVRPVSAEYKGRAFAIELGALTVKRAWAVTINSLGESGKATAAHLGESVTAVRSSLTQSYAALGALNARHAVTRQFELGAYQPADAESPALVAPLKEREQEVLRLAAQGYTLDDIGDELRIHGDTALYHAQNINEKWGTPNMTGAVLLGHLDGILPADEAHIAVAGVIDAPPHVPAENEMTDS